MISWSVWKSSELWGKRARRSATGATEHLEEGLLVSKLEKPETRIPLPGEKRKNLP
jgi:hypothetical protein